MRILSILIFGCFATLASAQVPVNNECAGAIVLAAPGTFAFDTTNATNTSGITNGGCPASATFNLTNGVTSTWGS